MLSWRTADPRTVGRRGRGLRRAPASWRWAGAARAWHGVWSPAPLAAWAMRTGTPRCGPRGRGRWRGTERALTRRAIGAWLKSTAMRHAGYRILAPVCGYAKNTRATERRAVATEFAAIPPHALECPTARRSFRWR